MELKNSFQSFYSIIHSEAASSYGKLLNGPSDTGEGKKTSRLTLINSSFPFATTAAHVYVETIEKGYWGGLKKFILSQMDKRFVKASINKEGKDHTIFINVNSLSKRLGITSEEIYRSALEGTLEDTLKKASTQYQEIEQKVIKHYDQFVQNYQISSKNNELYTKESCPTHTGMTSHTLYKLIGVAYGSLSKSSTSSFIKMDNKKFLFTFYRNQAKQNYSLKIIHFFDNTIGEGCSGSVKKVTDVFNGTTHVAKLAVNPFFKTEIATEFSILNSIHANGQVIGIQKAPYQLFQVGEGESQKIGYIAPIYDRDLKDWPTDAVSIQNQFQCMTQLLFGLNYCASQNIRIGDIKPDNCLLKVTEKDKKKIYTCVLSDFGGAAKLDGNEAVDLGIFTRAYECEQDYKSFMKLRKQFFEALNKGHEQEADQLREKMREIQKARDVYALGLTFKEVFHLKGAHPEIKRQFQALLKNMTHSDYTKRLSAQNALKEINRLQSSL